MKKIMIIFSILIISSVMAFSQTPPLQEQQNQIVLKPMLKIEDIAFSYNTLNTVEITGNEVESYLACRDHLQKTLEAAQAKSMKPTDSLKVDFPLPIAQNTLNLLNRAKITGAQAVQFKRFTDAIVTSSKDYKAPGK